jgi:hypothetical protein
MPLSVNPNPCAVDVDEDKVEDDSAADIVVGSKYTDVDEGMGMFAAEENEDAEEDDGSSSFLSSSSMRSVEERTRRCV